MEECRLGLSAGTAAAGGSVNVLAATQVGDNVVVTNKGAVTFAQSAGTVRLLNVATISVASGGVLDLDNSAVTAEAPLSYVDNYGTVQKTGGGTTDVQVGLINEAVTSQLVVNGGTNARLKFDGQAPNSTASVWQKNGNTQLYNGSTLYVGHGYQQDAGNLNAVGAASAATSTGLVGPEGPPNQTALINGGAVVLSSGSIFHQSTLISNLNFWFKSGSQLQFGINLSLGKSDLLIVNGSVQIDEGAQAVLDTSNQRGRSRPSSGPSYRTLRKATTTSRGRSPLTSGRPGTPRVRGFSETAIFCKPDSRG